MASKLCCILPKSMFLVLPYFTSPSLAQMFLHLKLSHQEPFANPPLTLVTANSSHNENVTVYNYGQFFVRKFLSHSQKTLNLIDKYLNQYRSSLSITAIRAFEEQHGFPLEFL
ncbi:hypothetical protein CCACVL1_04813 [Corchorus capsularis]|uniref:Uncharacterized protein n=1 Tax=Corchorus capsularis TaxID=210143 RepID=A0A1R3JPF7_COCAP|nr:hypothetical protein CCACVL1_04813 [Corchorus capsularis]